MTTPTELAPRDADAQLDAVLAPVRAAGAHGRAVLACADEWEVTLASGAVESVQRSRSQGISLRVILDDGRSASATCNDFARTTVARLAEDCLALAGASAPDEWMALPDAACCGLAEVAGLSDDQDGFSEDAALAAAKTADGIAREDPRIIATHRGGVESRVVYRRLRSTDGVDLATGGTRYAMAVVAVAQEGAEKQTGYDITSARRHGDLRAPANVAAEAVRRATEGFGWRKAPSGPCRVLFDQRSASGLLGLVGSLCSGQAVYRGSTCWADRLGQAVAAEGVTILDDPGIDGGLGSRPCDAEGVRGERLALIEDGRLQRWLTDSYSARRLSLPLTGHAGGTSNLILTPGEWDPQALLRELGTGLLVTGLHGHGVDTTSGHWSKGAQGFWVVDGHVQHPVQEVTLAGSIQDIFRGIRAIGNDPLPESSTCSPSLLIEGLTLGGA